MARNRVVVRLDVDRVRSWDHRKLGLDPIELGGSTATVRRLTRWPDGPGPDPPVTRPAAARRLLARTAGRSWPVEEEQPVRIALLSYRSKPHCGGQGVYVRHLSRELVRLGHEVEVFSGQPYPDLDDGVALTKVPSLDLYREPDPFRVPQLA